MRAHRMAFLVIVGGAFAIGLVADVAHSEAPLAPASASASNAPGALGPPVADEVPFDHTIHAGKYGIPCLDCHVYAAKSPVAGVPTGRKCMGCHKFVAKQNPAVQKLAARFEAGDSLRWRRVFFLPDYIYFSHRMHVRADVACSECHGDVASMKKVVQREPFTMGRCLACHEKRHATRNCVGCHK